MDYTGIEATGTLYGNGRWWHFGKGPGYGRPYKRKWVDEHYAHIPIRNPLHVAKSWASRDKTGDVLGAMLDCYGEMFDYLDVFPAKLYRIEDIPRTQGMNEHGDGDHSKQIEIFQSAVREHVIEPHRDFFEQFYDDL